VTKTHSRPHVSNDNPYSEAQFKTLKYRPGFPDRFGSLQDARTFCQAFFTWYNRVHRHSGIAMMTPEAVHYGHAPQLHQARAEVLAGAYAAIPNGSSASHPCPSPCPPPYGSIHPSHRSRPLSNQPAPASQKR
jgi:putative transposase